MGAKHSACSRIVRSSPLYFNWRALQQQNCLQLRSHSPPLLLPAKRPSTRREPMHAKKKAPIANADLCVIAWVLHCISALQDFLGSCLVTPSLYRIVPRSCRCIRKAGTAARSNASVAVDGGTGAFSSLASRNAVMILPEICLLEQVDRKKSGFAALEHSCKRVVTH